MFRQAVIQVANVEVPQDASWHWLLCQAAPLNDFPLWAKALAQKLRDPSANGSRERTERVALGRLVELRRRDQRMSTERLADRAGVELAELIEIEAGARQVVEPRTVFVLSEVLRLPIRGLMKLAGLAKIDDELSGAAARFTARLRPTSRLSREEHEVLASFLRALNDLDDSNGALKTSD